MDADTTVCKDAYTKILGAFRAGKLDVLVGTQMIAKGLHFPNVTLVGILNADSALHLPDFRAGERTFQLLTQVAGRAGRGDVAGEVIVQTSTPFHPAIQAARRLDFEGFADQELAFREDLSYPPFARLICLTIRGMEEERVASSSKEFATALEKVLPPTVILAGPVPAPLAKAKKYYRQQVILRTPQINLAVRPLRDLLATFRWPAGVQCAVDVDAMSLL